MNHTKPEVAILDETAQVIEFLELKRSFDLY
jgi:hypothetical protein